MMKKSVFFVVLMGALIMASPIFAQVAVTVKGTPVVQLNIGGEKVVIKNGQKEIIQLPCAEAAEISAIYLLGNDTKRAKVSKPAGQCEMVLEVTSSGLENTYRPETVSSPFVSTPGPSINTGSGRMITSVNIRLLNSTGHDIAILGGPFKGVALQPLDTSQARVSVNTGVLNFPIIFTDTADNKQLRQVVITRIITQDMEELEIKQSDFGIAVRGKVKLFAFNETKVKFVFTNGIFSGYALSPDKRCSKKLDLAFGFQNFVIEFYGADGLKRRANLEKIVTPHDPAIRVVEADLKKAYIVQD